MRSGVGLMNGAEPTRTVTESRVVLAQHMGVSDSNLAGAVHGGTIMKLVDTAGGLAAMKFSGHPVVTAAIDELSFLEPVNLGDLVTVTASVNGVGNTTMEVGVRVETENVMTGETRHTSTAYLLFVALDPETRQPVRVPRLVTESTEERRRERQAKARRKARIARRKSTLSARAESRQAAERKKEQAEARRKARLAAKEAEAAAQAQTGDAIPEPAPAQPDAEIKRWRPKPPKAEPALVGSTPASQEPADLTKWRRHSSR